MSIMIHIFENPIHLLLANAASNSIPNIGWEWYHKYNDKHSIKYGSTNPDRLPKPIHMALEGFSNEVSCLYECNDEIYAKDIFPDYNYHAGGIHIIPPGGFLSRHLDCEYHPTKNWKRTGSLVWFANREWKEEWGGQLVIEPLDKNEPISITPKFNTAVYFETPNTYHQVLPVIGPYVRKTLTIFFWSEVPIKPKDGKTTAYFPSM